MAALLFAWVMEPFPSMATTASGSELSTRWSMALRRFSVSMSALSRSRMLMQLAQEVVSVNVWMSLHEIWLAMVSEAMGMSLSLKMGAEAHFHSWNQQL